MADRGTAYTDVAGHFNLPVWNNDTVRDGICVFEERTYVTWANWNRDGAVAAYADPDYWQIVGTQGEGGGPAPKTSGQLWPRY